MNFHKIARSVSLSVAIGMTTISSVSANDEVVPVTTECSAAATPCYADCDDSDADQPFVPPQGCSVDDRPADALQPTVISNSVRSLTAKSSSGWLSNKSLCCRRAIYSAPMAQPMPQPMPQQRPAAQRPMPQAPRQAYAPAPYAPPAYAPAPYAPAPYPQAAYAPPAQYAPAPAYSAPAPAPVYAAPAPAPAPAPRTYAAAPAPAPAPPAPAAPVGDIVLNNLEKGAISYTVNGTRYDMNPGFAQKLTNRASWTIEFDRGTGQGNARYSLTPGSYQFIASEKGWDLFKQDDNPQPPAPIPSYENFARK